MWGSLRLVPIIVYALFLEHFKKLLLKIASTMHFQLMCYSDFQPFWISGLPLRNSYYTLLLLMQTGAGSTSCFMYFQTLYSIVPWWWITVYIDWSRHLVFVPSIWATLPWANYIRDIYGLILSHVCKILTNKIIDKTHSKKKTFRVEKMNSRLVF